LRRNIRYEEGAGGGKKNPENKTSSETKMKRATAKGDTAETG